MKKFPPSILRFQSLKSYLLATVFLGGFSSLTTQASSSTLIERDTFHQWNQDIVLRLRSHLRLLEWKVLGLTSKNLASQIQQAETALGEDQGYQSFRIDRPLQQGLKRLHKKILQATQAERDVYTSAKQALQDRANEASFRNDLAALPLPVQSLFDNVLKNLMPPYQLINSRPEWREGVLAAVSLTPSSQQLKVLQIRLQNLKALKSYLPSKEAVLLKKVEEAYEDFVETICTLSSVEEKKDFLEPRAYLQIESDYSYLILPSLAQALQSKDRYGASTRHLNNQEAGKNNVFAKGGVHFKATASSDGIKSAYEWAVHSLSVLLLGPGWTPPSATLCLRQVPFKGFEQEEIFKIKNPEEKYYAQLFNQKVLPPPPSNSWTRERFFAEYPEAALYLQDFKKDSYLQASETSGEISLLQFFEQIQTRDSHVTDLNEEAYSGMVVLGLLLGFADAKDDNYRLQGNRLMSIDNEDILAPFIVQESHRHYIQTKNTLFLLPELMAKPVHSTVVARITQLDAPSLILKWFYLCHQQNQHYEQAFKSLKLPAENMPTVIRFGRETALTLKRNLEKMQSLLSQQSSCSHQQLFESLCPEAALFYQRLATRYPQEPQKAQQILWGSGQAVESLSLEDLLTEPDHQEKLSSFTEKLGDYQFRDFQTNRPHPPLTPEQAAESFLRRLEPQDLLQNPCKPLLTFMFAQPFPAVFYPAKNLPENLKKEELFVKALVEGCEPFVIDYLLSLGHTAENFDPHLMRNGFHAAVLGKVPLSVLEKLVQTVSPSQRPELLNAKDKKNLTPLDLSMDGSTLNIPAFKYLMSVDAFDCNDQISLKFYKRYASSLMADEELKNSFQKLMKLNSAIEWQIALFELLPAKDEPGYIWTAQDLEVISSTYGLRVLPQRYKNQIFTSKGKIIPLDCQSTHQVAYFKGQGALQEHGLYLKFYPALPGLEEASGRFTRNFLSFGAPYTDLLKIGDHLGIVSQEIPGDTLHATLKQYPQKLQNLDSEDVIGLILMAMLINPEDGKPDNYIVAPHPFKEGQYRLIGIDNDQGFVPAFAREKPLTTLLSNQTIPVAQVKTILYCLDQMKEAVPDSLRTKLINTQPDFFLETWLKQLKRVGERQLGIFEQVGQAENYFVEHKSFVGIPFRAGIIKHIYEKFVHLRNILIADPSVTPLTILCKIEPRLAKRYHRALEQTLSPLERFKIVDQPFYEIAKNQGNFTTLTRSADILQSMDIPLKQDIFNLIRQGKQFGPVQALQELETLKKEISYSPLKVSKDQPLTDSGLNSLTLEKSRVSFFKTLLQQRKILSSLEQNILLTYLSNQTYVQELPLANFTFLTDNLFERLPLEHLQRLDLRNCTRLTNNSLITLASQALALEELNVAGLNNLKEIKRNLLGTTPLEFLSLRTLNLAGCINLTTFNIRAPFLKWLNLKECTILQVSILKNLNFPNLSYFNLEGCRSFQDNSSISLVLAEIYEKGQGVKKNEAQAVVWYKRAAEQGNSIARQHLIERDKQASYQNNQGDMYYYGGYGVEADYGQAIELYQKAADKGNASAQANLGHMYQNGFGIEKDYAKALEWYKQAAEQGNASAQYNLGYMYQNGFGTEKDYAKALEWYQKAAEQNHATAQNNLGDMYYYGYGVEQDYGQAIRLYQQAADKGNASAQANLGHMYQNGFGTEKDYAKALEWYQKAADKGNASAQANLGHMYQNGFGIEKDYAKALEWYKQAAEQGNASAQDNLGYMYQNGFGTEKDYAKALEWYQKAAEQGNASAQSNLGQMYENGLGVDKDDKQAFKYYKLASSQGNTFAKINLGQQYLNGRGVSQDYEKALELFKEVISQGDSQGDSQGYSAIAVMYYKGYGVKQNFETAREYLLQGAEQNHHDAQYGLGVLYKNVECGLVDYKEALSCFKKAAAQDHLGALEELGDMYYEGLGVEKDYCQAIKWYQQAANKGEKSSQNSLAYMYFKGFGVDKDYKTAFGWYQQAAVQGNSGGQAMVGWMYLKGLGVNKDYIKAWNLFEKAAAQGNANAKVNLGWMCLKGLGMDKDYAKALQFFQKADENSPTSNGGYWVGWMYQRGLGVERDDKMAQTWFQKIYNELARKEDKSSSDKASIGRCYFFGEGVERDFKQGYKWLKEAAEEDSNAQAHLLGRLYKEGLGIEANKEKAFFWIEKSADQDDFRGLYNLGLLYRDGEGVAQNDSKAIECFKKAAQQNNENALYSLGWMYEQGRGVEKDDHKALIYYQEGEKTHAEDALYSLGRVYEYGLGGVEKDLAKALEWYEKAAALHDVNAQDKVRHLKSLQ